MKRIVLALGLILLSMAALYGCGKDHEFTELTRDDANADWKPLPTPVNEDELLPQTDIDPISAGSSDSPQLTALADSLEEAQEIADLYGIELDSYSYGVAAYHTDKDISELIRLGLENDYPTLAPNDTNTLYSEQESN